MIIHDTLQAPDRFIVFFGPDGYEYPTYGHEHAGFCLRALQQTCCPAFSGVVVSTGRYIATPSEVEWFVMTCPNQMDGLVIEGFHYSPEFGIRVHLRNITEERIDIRVDDVIGQLEFVLKFEGSCEWRHIYCSTQPLPY